MKACKDLFFPPLFVLTGLLPVYAFSTPSGAEVVSGDVSISHGKNGVTTIEASDRSIINYDSFSVDIGETVKFIQPEASATVLNKVVGSDPSLILGKLQSNGRVFVVNQNGVYFGSSAKVDMGSLIVSTLDIAATNFAEGELEFVQTDFASIINQGKITATQDVVMISSRIDNRGKVLAKKGRVVMAAGEKVSLDFTGDGLVSFAVEGIIEKAEILHTGAITAVEGEVLLSVGEMHKVIEETINTDGILFGETFVEEEGGIFLAAKSHIEGQNVTCKGKGSALFALAGTVKAEHEVIVEAEIIDIGETGKIYSKGEELARISLFSREKTFFSGKLSAKEGLIELGSSKRSEIYSSNIAAAEWRFRGKTALYCDIQGQGADILFKGAAELAQLTHIDTGGGSLAFERTVDGGGLQITAGQGEVRFSKDLGGHHPLSEFTVTDAERLLLGRNLYTAGGEVLFGVPLLLLSDVKVDTTGGGAVAAGAKISLLHGAFGNHRLNLNAGKEGVLDIAEGAGNGSSALSAILMNGSSIRLKGNIKADGGTVIFTGPVIIEDDITIEDTGPTGILFFGSVDSQNLPVSLTLIAPLGKVGFYGIVGDDTPLNDVTITSREVQLGGDLNFFGDCIITGPIKLTDNTSLKATSLLISDPIDGGFDLKLDVGLTGWIIIGNDIGSTTRLNNFEIEASGLTRTKAIYARSIKQELGLNTTVFDGILSAEGSDGIELNGFEFELKGGALTTDGGPLNIIHSGDIQIEAPVNLGGSFVESGGGDVLLSSHIITQNQSVAFNGAVILEDHVYISTGSSGSGDITFADEIDGEYSLTLDAGMGDISFDRAIGSDEPLEDLFVVSVNNLTLEQSVQATSYTQLDGHGIGTYNGNILTTGVMGIYVFSFGIDTRGDLAGQLFKTVGLGNVIMNSYYRDLGSFASPVYVSVSNGSGTFFEGSSHNVFLASGVGEIGSICTVRSNPGAPVYYKEGSSAYEEVTPNICCTSDPTPPPPGPPDEEQELYYIPGTYTNYWEFKDTLGAPWYFREGFRHYKSYFVSRLGGLFAYKESDAYLFARRGSGVAPMTKIVFFFALPFLIFFSAFKVSQKGARRKQWLLSVYAKIKKHVVGALDRSLLQ